MRRTMLGIVAVALAAAGCTPMWANVDPSFSTAVLTQEPATDTYNLAYDPGSASVSVSAPQSNTGGNSRGVFWPAGQTPAMDGESCARWAAEDGGTTVVPNIQEGAALRVRKNSDGSVDAVTVTRNVEYGAVWIYNEHIWNTNQSPAFTQLGGVNLQNVFDPSGDGHNPAPLPWHLCAKTVGATLTFVAWLDGTPQPQYGDSSHGGSVTLPSNYVYPGNWGWYIGHLQAGQFVRFDTLSPAVTTTTTTTAAKPH